ncbi:hypothetical protein MUG91_G133n17 [Manis pentadactyla]|nr:hypothetical protein MUG91_G133n17 [Manis pentadactyla]
MQKDPPLWRQEEEQQQACMGTTCESMTCGKIMQKIEEDDHVPSVVMSLHDWSKDVKEEKDRSEFILNYQNIALWLSLEHEYYDTFGGKKCPNATDMVEAVEGAALPALCSTRLQGAQLHKAKELTRVMLGSQRAMPSFPGAVNFLPFDKWSKAAARHGDGNVLGVMMQRPRTAPKPHIGGTEVQKAPGLAQATQLTRLKNLTFSAS